MLEPHAAGEPVEVLPHVIDLVVLPWERAVEAMLPRAIGLRRRQQRRPDPSTVTRFRAQVRWSGDIAHVRADAELGTRRDSEIEPAGVLAGIVALLRALGVEQV